MVYWTMRRVLFILFLATIIIIYLLSTKLSSNVLYKSHITKDLLFSVSNQSSDILNKSHFTKDLLFSSSKQSSDILKKSHITEDLLFSSSKRSSDIVNKSHITKDLLFSSSKRSSDILNKSHITEDLLFSSSKQSSGILNKSHITKDLLFSFTKQWSGILNESHFTKDSSLPTLTFGDSKQLPFFYKPVLSHPNDIYREKYTIAANRPLKQDLIKSKLILFFNIPGWFKEPYMPSCQEGIQKCPVTSCKCSDNPKYLSKADAVIIDGVELQRPDPPVKYPNQVWIFYGIEPPTGYQRGTTFRSKNWSHMFNWTMTYRLDSDVVAPYDVLIRHNDRSMKNFTEIALRKTKSAFWLTSHCETQSKREEYVRNLKEYYPVDIYGQCGSQKRRFEGDMKALSKDYRFYLSFESVLCDDYVTEKLYRIYDRGMHVIPVVRGKAKYSSLYPNGTYINTADFSSPKKLAEHLKYLERNVKAYSKILNEKDRYIGTGDLGKLASPFCDVCIKLHNLEIFSNHYPNVSRWLEEGIFHTPDDY